MEGFDWYVRSLTSQWDVQFKERTAVKIQARPKERELRAMNRYFGATYIVSVRHLRNETLKREV